MTTSHSIALLFGGVAAALIVASLVATALNWRLAGDAPGAALDNLNRRIKAWWVMVALLGAASVFGKAGVVVLFALTSLAALREFITLTPTRRSDHAALVLAFFVVVPLQYYLVWIDWYGLYSVFIPIFVFLLLASVAVLRGDTKDFSARVAETQWGLTIAVFALSHVPALLGLRIRGYEGRGLLLIGFLLIVVQSSDVLQFVWGKVCGRRKIAPTLSPSKTVEGFVGGVACGTALGAWLWWITPFSPVEAAAIALLINLMGFFGGLVMSAIKRDRGVKDWGWMIDGHGGILDRVDSLVFAAPVFFHVIRYFHAV